MKNNSYESARKYAFRLLACSPRSIRETEERLKVKGFPRDSVSRVLVELAEAGYLDDEKFARDFILAKLANSPAGKKYLRAALLGKKVDEAAAEKALEEVLTPEREHEAACRAAVKLFSRYSRVGEKEKAGRVYLALLRKGFPPETAEDAAARKSPDGDYC